MTPSRDPEFVVDRCIAGRAWPRSAVLVNATGVRSGAETVLVAVAHALAAEGADLTLVSPPGPLVEDLPPGTRHVAIDTLGLEGTGGSARLAGIARVVMGWVRAGRTLRSVTGSGEPVVVNSLFALPILRWSYLRRRHMGPVTWLVHDTVVNRKQRIAVNLGASRLDKAVAVSEVTAESVRSMFPAVVVRPNGVRIDDQVISSSGREQVVGILAALTPWKGQDVLLEAVALVPGLQVEIAGGEFPGEASYAEVLRARALRPDLRGRVQFLGHVDRAEVLSRWAVAVSASVLPEAGPLGVLECMAAGLPVVATDHGGAAEYLADGAGVLVPPGNVAALARALQDLMSDPAERDEIARIARRRAEIKHDIRVTLPAMVETLMAL